MKKKKGVGGRPRGSSNAYVTPTSMHRLMKKETPYRISEAASVALATQVQYHAHKIVDATTTIMQQKKGSQTVTQSDVEAAARLVQ